MKIFTVVIIDFCLDIVKRISLFNFVKEFNELSPKELKLYDKGAILNLFEEYKYVDCALTKNEKQYIISVDKNIEFWDLPIIEPYKFTLKDL